MADPGLYLASLNPAANLLFMSGGLSGNLAGHNLLDTSSSFSSSLNPTSLSLSDALKFTVSSCSGNTNPDFTSALANFGSNPGSNSALSGSMNDLTNPFSYSAFSSSSGFSPMGGARDSLTNQNATFINSSTNETRSKAGGALPQPLPNESSTNLITNYLPPTMKQEEVRALFSAIGEVESCKLVRDKITGQSLCYAFVNFKEPRDASVAVHRLNGIVVGNKKIKVSFARPSSPSIKDANLYISGIPKDVTAADLEKLFSEVGSIITSRILLDPTTGQSRGVGFIRFDHRGDAERAIQRFDNYPITGRNGGPTEKLTVKFANTPSHHSQKALHQAYFTASQRRLAASPLAFTGPALHQTIKNFRFSPLGGVAAAAAPATELSSALAGIPALAAVTNPAAAAAAQPPVATLAAAANLAQPAGGGHCLFVYNLSSDCEEKEIWQLFGPLGAVQSVKLVFDENKKCKGFGFVTMNHYDESVKAIQALNGAPYNNRVLQVSFKSAVAPTSPKPL